MRISMSVVQRGGNIERSTFDEVDIRESGQDIGEAIGEAIDMELSNPETIQLSVIITL